MIDRSFQLLRTNPRLTTNIKMVVTSDDKLYLESFNTNKQLSDEKFKHFQLDRESTYEYSLTKFFDGLPAQLAFDVKFDNDTQFVFNTYDKQFDDIYWSGAKSIEDKWYNENFEYFAPLYIKKNKLPESFVILRVDDPLPYEEKNNNYSIAELSRDNFFNQVVDKWKCVSLVDLRYQTNIGYYMNNNIIDNDRFPASPFELDFRKYEFSKWYGIDYNAGVYTAKSKYMTTDLYLEQPHFKLEKIITNGYRDNDLVFPNIWNMKFLFNDKPATPSKYREYSINRYYGFYIDELEFVTNLTSYITPTVKPGVTLLNNIFMSGGTEMTVTPFTEKYDANKDYFVYWDDQFFEVVKILKNGNYVYSLVATEDLISIDFTKTNDRVCFISYEEGSYNCLTYDNPSGYTNLIKGYTDDFIIDQYITTDGVTYDVNDMYGDLYLIKIDDIYHILKNRGDDYFIQSDYAINSYPTGLEYWKGGDDPIQKDINVYGDNPLVYPVYRLRFSDIKDFDFDKVNTKFSDFDFEKDEYFETSEQKLYATEYLDLSIDKEFKIHPKGEEGQYKVMNISSEYIADDELFEIKNNDLTEIWRKNEYINKWGFLGSNSNADYPYKLNNSISVGDTFNRTTDVLITTPVETSKNLDYFYRIGNTTNSGGTTQRYLNQSIFLETELMDQTFSEKFNLDLYLDSDVDYFNYFFRNKMYYELYGQKYIKPTLKYSVFDGGDDYNVSSTIFKGINFDIFGLDEITRTSSNDIANYMVNRDSYNGYKFSIILNDVYNYYDESGTFLRKYTNGLQNNNTIDENVNGIHIFLNDKFKNVLCIINAVIPFNSGYTSFNNVEDFGEKFGLYNSKTISGDAMGFNNVNPYNPIVFSASNFIMSINDLNNKTFFDSGVTYYYINSDSVSGSTGPMDEYITGNTMSMLTNWEKSSPPFLLVINYPEQNNTKIDSYLKSAIKGPSTNIYDKYSVYYNEKSSQQLDVVQPLARSMDVNETINKNVTIRSGDDMLYENSVYRYNGKYEPIFKSVSIFDSSNIYLSLDSGLTMTGYSYWKNNYKFGYDYSRFGIIDELIYSKVNSTVNPLKLKKSNFDKSIYPMVDEFGYQFSSRFIFSSSWDNNFYLITKPDQISIPKKIRLSDGTSVTTTDPPPAD